MYFVHPQIKFSLKNLKSIFSCLFFEKKSSLQKLEEMFPGKKIYFLDMGRVGFKIAIEKFSLQKTKMILPAFICEIFWPILKDYQIEPIFVDVKKETFNLDPDLLDDKILKEAKSILVSHNFGLPAEIEKIKEKISNYNLILIEDCAHALGAKIGEKFCGNFGDCAIFSLYKRFPTARGGMIVLENKIEKLEETKFNLRDFISFLNHFSFFSFIFKKFGKKISKKIERKEKKGIGKINFFSKNLFLNFFENFEQKTEKRKKLAIFLIEELEKLGFKAQQTQNNIFTYFSVLVPEKIDRDKFVKELAKKGIFATRIWRKPIIFNREIRKIYKIKLENFKNTFEIAKRIVNIPLQDFFEKKDAEKIIEKIKIVTEKIS
jgi:dTDP-4-amino-4,6-dideoxygalactose transaminase